MAKRDDNKRKEKLMENLVETLVNMARNMPANQPKENIRQSQNDLMLFQVHMKSLYRHKRTGDIFAIETDDAGQVISTSEPLFGDDFNPKMLDYDEYLQRADYMELLRQNGFYHRP